MLRVDINGSELTLYQPNRGGGSGGGKLAESAERNPVGVKLAGRAMGSAWYTRAGHQPAKGDRWGAFTGAGWHALMAQGRFSDFRVAVEPGQAAMLHAPVPQQHDACLGSVPARALLAGGKLNSPSPQSRFRQMAHARDRWMLGRVMVLAARNYPDYT